MHLNSRTEIPASWMKSPSWDLISARMSPRAARTANLTEFRTFCGCHWSIPFAFRWMIHLAYERITYAVILQAKFHYQRCIVSPRRDEILKSDQIIKFHICDGVTKRLTNKLGRRCTITNFPLSSNFYLNSKFLMAIPLPQLDHSKNVEGQRKTSNSLIFGR